MRGDCALDILAPAKINLFLSIKAKRADGYHELETVMQKVDLADRISLKKTASGVSINCRTSGLALDPPILLPENDSNIAHRAAAAFFEQSGVDGGVEISLEKRIPIAAGLGGGSSDAAAVLLGLNRLYPPGLSLKEQFSVAGTLGADVPFFVAKEGAVLASGIGELLTAVPSLARCWIVLINPGFPVSTKWVYDNYALTSGGNPYILGRDLDYLARYDCFAEMLNDVRKHELTALYNDLEEITIREYPEIKDLENQLLKDGALFAMMSGSGPTMFGVFSDKEKAENSYNAFKSNWLGVFMCKPVQ